MNKDEFVIFHDNFSKVAGTERVLKNIIDHLISKGKKVCLLLASEETELVFDINDLPIEIIYLRAPINNSTRLTTIMSMFTLFRKVKAFVKTRTETKCTILCSNFLLAYLCYKSTKKNKSFRIISCEHFSFHISSNFSVMLRKVFYKNVNVVTLTERDRNVVTEITKANKVVCIPNAIPFELSSYKGHDSKIILAIGRYTYQKGFDLLIEAYSKISKDFLDWKLVIVGDDYGELKRMEELIDLYKIENIELHPASNKIRDYYNKASFYVMSSRYEGLPMVLLEAMGHGLPIVSFDCPTGPAEVLDKTNGILVENGNIEQLGEEVKRLIKDERMRGDLALGAQRKAMNYSREVINRNWDLFFEDIWK